MCMCVCLRVCVRCVFVRRVYVCVLGVVAVKGMLAFVCETVSACVLVGIGAGVNVTVSACASGVRLTAGPRARAKVRNGGTHRLTRSQTELKCVGGIIVDVCTSRLSQCDPHRPDNNFTKLRLLLVVPSPI